MRFAGFSRIDGYATFRIYTNHVNNEPLQIVLDRDDSWITQDGIATKLYTAGRIAQIVNSF